MKDLSSPNRPRAYRKNKTAKFCKKPLRIAITGIGWNGAEAAKALKAKGHEVFAFEAGKDVASGTSGKYASHSHPTGLHYLRTDKTRRLCSIHYKNFAKKRSKYFRSKMLAIHGIVRQDATGAPSRTSAERFRAIYQKEDSTAKKVDISSLGLQGFDEAISISEESIIVGNDVREEFRKDLTQSGVHFFCDTKVTSIEPKDGKYILHTPEISSEFDVVVNATGFQKFLPEDFDENPFGIEVVYQVATGLLYEDIRTGEKKAFSLLLLDGANPSFMPTDGGKYILTHAVYTLLASCSTSESAHEILGRVTDEFMETKVKPLVEADLMRYYPDFLSNFRYVGFNGGVIAKPVTEVEFRAGFTFQDPEGVIHAFPGKVINSLDVAEEVSRLVDKNKIATREGYRYPRGGTLCQAQQDIADKPSQPGKHYASSVNPYPELHETPSLTRGGFSIFSRYDDKDSSKAAEEPTTSSVCTRRLRSGSEDLDSSLFKITL